MVVVYARVNYTNIIMQITPQRQLAFSTTTPAGSGSGVGVSAGTGAGVGGAGGASDPRGLTQSYKLASPDISLSSSTGSSSLRPSPSPASAPSPLEAYRGRRAPTGRPALL